MKLCHLIGDILTIVIFYRNDTLIYANEVRLINYAHFSNPEICFVFYLLLLFDCEDALKGKDFWKKRFTVVKKRTTQVFGMRSNTDPCITDSLGAFLWNEILTRRSSELVKIHERRDISVLNIEKKEEKKSFHSITLGL